MIEIIDGSFGYGDGPEILKDINLSLERGDSLSVLGPNGVGKTTFIKCVIGLLDWTSGHSTIDGTDIRNLSDREVFTTVSYVPQKRKSTFSYTGLEMVVLGCASQMSIFEQPGPAQIQKARETMEKIGVSHLADKECSQMSGGELQMVLIARGLVSDPDILVLDEPESGLDFKNQLVILKLLKDLRKDNITSIINTHYPNHALMISNKCLLLEQSRYKVGATDDILKSDNLRDAFGVEVVIDDIDYKDRTYRTIIPTEIL